MGPEEKSRVPSVEEAEAALSSNAPLPEEHPVVVTIDNRFLRGGEEVPDLSKHENRILKVVPFETPPAFVRRGYGLTLNLGNFESARVDISLTVPCYVQDVEEADEFARQFVERRIKAETASARGNSDDKSAF